MDDVKLMALHEGPVATRPLREKANKSPMGMSKRTNRPEG